MDWIKEQHCTRDIKLLAVSIRPCCLTREVSHVIITVYILPLPDAAATCELLHTVVSQLQTQHPQSLLIISEDFNSAPLSSTVPSFTQYVKCHTRDNKTLELLYANLKEAYTSSTLPLLGLLDHNLVHLLTDYIPMVNKNLPQKKSVMVWLRRPVKG